MNKNINDVTLGILSGLESLGNMETEEQKSKRVKEVKNIGVKEVNYKIEKDVKIKRSFMLTSEQIQMLYEIKLKYITKDLSEIIGESIEFLYKRVKE